MIFSPTATTVIGEAPATATTTTTDTPPTTTTFAAPAPTSEDAAAVEGIETDGDKEVEKEVEEEHDEEDDCLIPSDNSPLSNITSLIGTKIKNFKTYNTTNNNMPCGTCASFSEIKMNKFLKSEVGIANWTLYNTTYFSRIYPAGITVTTRIYYIHIYIYIY